MLGSRYRLGKPTRAVYADEDAKGFVLLPEGAVLTIDSLDRTGRLLRIRWNNLPLLMFWQDLMERGVEIDDSMVRNVRAAAQRL
jgi:hypothetical protein